MAFDLKIWKEKVQENLKGWKPRLERTGVNSVYAFISAVALWPVVEAAQAGKWAALAALGGVLSGLGSNLLADQIQTWKDEKGAARQLEQAVKEDPALRAELDTVLETLGALKMAGNSLSEEDRQWFAETLKEELAQIGSGIRYDATLIGGGAIAQGEQSIAIGAGGKLEYTHIENQTLPDTLEVAAKKQSEARKCYLRQLYRDCQTLPLADLGGDPGSGESITLKDVYIALNTTHRITASKSKGRTQEENVETLMRGTDERLYTALEAVEDNSHLVLLGGPGSGKSTFGRYLAAWQAAAELGEVERPAGVPQGLLPVFIVLRDLIPRLGSFNGNELSAKERNTQLVDIFREQISAELKRLHGEELIQELDKLLSSGKCLLVLDGLDEVSQGLRANIRQAVSALRDAYPIERVLLTCRVRSYAGEAIQAGFTRYTLASFNQKQVQDFARGWYQAQAEKGEVQAEQVKTKADDLARAAWEPDLRELAMNPMMLTTMAIIHQKEYKLPTQRVRLYNLAVDVLLQRWQKRKTGEELTDNPDLNALLKDDLRLRRIMERLAYEAHKSGEKDDAADLPRMGAIKILEEENYISNLELAKQFLDYVDQRAGLLVGRGGEPNRPTDYSFPHRTFQEYLAGSYLTGHRRAVRMIIEHAEEPEYWSLAVEMGVEEIYYNGSSIGINSVLDLMYQLFPLGEMNTDIQARRVLWAGKMAVIVEPENLRRDEVQDGEVVLAQLQETLVEIIKEKIGANTDNAITAPERADAGCVLAKLGDLRTEILDVNVMPLCYIPAGPFLMGSQEEDDEYADVDEQPQHKMDLPAYWISRYPITNAQYTQFVQVGGYDIESYWLEAQEDGIWKKGKIHLNWADEVKESFTDYGEPFNLPNHPVVGVTWYEALAFTRWLTDQWQEKGFLPENWRVILPSEAEWEKAARGGIKIPKQPNIQVIGKGLVLLPKMAMKTNSLPSRVYPWGNDFDSSKANVGAAGIESTSTPGCFSDGCSPFGAEDLSGNVWEWTRTKGGGNYEKYKDDNDLKGSPPRVLRGGAFFNYTWLVRCAYRSRYNPVYRNHNFGFRVVASPSPRRAASGI